MLPPKNPSRMSRLKLKGKKKELFGKKIAEQQQRPEWIQSRRAAVADADADKSSQLTGRRGGRMELQ